VGYRASLPALQRRVRLEQVALQHSPRTVWHCLRYLIAIFRVNHFPHLQSLVTDKRWIEVTYGITPKMV
jgi:hypothetical protein